MCRDKTLVNGRFMEQENGYLEEKQASRRRDKMESLLLTLPKGTKKWSARFQTSAFKEPIEGFCYIRRGAKNISP
jgi:hypothetical protein